MKQSVLERGRKRAGTAASERRKPGLRCVSCGSSRCEVIAGHNDLTFRCLDCSSQWADRRTTSRLGPHCAPASEATHAAVLAICRAADDAALVAVTLEWLQRLTRADRVTFTSTSRLTCSCLDGNGKIEEVVLPAHEVETAIPREAQLLCELDADTAAASGWPHARSAALMPVETSKPIAVLAAYWTSPSMPTVWHLQTMQLLAEAVRTRAGAA